MKTLDSVLSGLGLSGIKQLQNYSSAKTSLPSNEPKGFKLIDWKKGTVNLDLGGGKTTFGTDYLKAKGVKNLIFDFNYPAEHNKEIAEYVRKNKVDTVTCFNVLNVLDTKEAISNMCLMAAKALKDNGTAYFQVYHKKDGKGASQNNQSYQQGEPLSFYVPFVSEYFENVKKTAELITASKPKKTAKKSQWQFAFDSDEGILFGLDKDYDDEDIKFFQENIWKNGLDSVSLQQLDNLINDIKNGRIKTYNDRRIARIAEQGEVANEQRLFESYKESRGESNALIAAEIISGIGKRIGSETFLIRYQYEQLLEKWARHSNCWIDNIEEYSHQNSWTRAPKSDGKESIIYTTPFNTIAKIWSMEKYNENLRLAVEKIILNNFFFGEDTFLNVIGFCKINHCLRFIILQPYIDYIEDSRGYNGIAIKNYLKEKFPNKDIDKYNDAYIVHLSNCAIYDLHGNNVVRTQSGNFYVIDCDIKYIKRNAISWYFKGFDNFSQFTPGTLIRYKDFDGTIYKIVDTTDKGYIVEDLSMPENLRTKNTIPFDNDNLLTECNLQTLELTTLQNPQLGNVVYENIPLPFDMQLAGLPDDDVELQFTEMKLLEIEKLHDFGEKIGGSAKDRYNGRHSQSGSGNNTNTKKGFNRLPTEEEYKNIDISDDNGEYLYTDEYYNDELYKKFKPSIADFEKIGLNKICARLCYFVYYPCMDYAGADGQEFARMITLAQLKENQNIISEYFLDHKRTMDYKDLPAEITGIKGFVVWWYQFYYTALSMNLEKEMKDDFDYQVAVKISHRGNRHWRYYRDKRIFLNNKVSADVKQKVFNIEYENVTNNYPVYRVMLSNKGVIFTEQKELTENNRSYRYSQKYVLLVEETYSNDWNKLWQNYADYYVKGKQLWEEKYGNEEKWKFTDKDGLVAEKRLNCKDWRNGKNAETTDFINTFGFRAVEFGETMPQKERWEHLNRTYDAFMDLCDILNIKPENISLGGTLGICFGSRGRGGKHAAAAHYEPGKRVINLTRKNGAGCLAHEWFHAFDNQVCDAGFGSENAVSLSDEWRSNKVFYYFNQFLLRTETMNWDMFEFARAAFALNRYERRSKPYWQKKLECAARAFEWYVITKLAEKDRINEYLAQIPKPEPDRLDYYPYPHEADYGSCKQIFDGIFENVVQEKTKYNFFTIKG